MAVAPIENGKPVETTSQTSLKESEKKKSNSTVDKDQFLQLLVAQMKYQDPLMPSSYAYSLTPNTTHTAT